MSRCAICFREFKEENAPILTISGYGKPRFLCPHCQELVDCVCDSNNKDEINLAISKIGAALTAANNDDAAVFSALTEIYEDARSRIEGNENSAPESEKHPDACELSEVNDSVTCEDAISCDGENEPACGKEESLETATAATEEFDIPDELRETEEDKALDEKEAKRGKVLDTVIGWSAAVILIATIIFFIVKFII